jgi:hypothetical protein
MINQRNWVLLPNGQMQFSIGSILRQNVVVIQTKTKMDGGAGILLLEKEI